MKYTNQTHICYDLVRNNIFTGTTEKDKIPAKWTNNEKHCDSHCICLLIGFLYLISSVSGSLMKFALHYHEVQYFPPSCNHMKANM
jgi:hypothetical protein